MATNLPAKAPDWRRDIEAMTAEFTRSLPAQMPTERFVRTVLTAVQMNPDLAAADRHSLKVACMKAAQDGLLPDGREGALVIYNTKVKRDGKEFWVPAVQWSPMVAGLLKKARNSGEIASITGHVVYKHDKFRLVFGDEELLEHEPNLDVDESELVEANAVGAYAVGKLKDGTIIRVWRSRGQIMKAKGQSKAQNSLMWTKFWEEGWIKTAIRYLTKYLPSSTDKEGVDTLARAAERDDEAYDFNRVRDVTPAEEGSKTKLDSFVETKLAAAEVNGDGQDPTDVGPDTTYDPDTGEVDDADDTREPEPLPDEIAIQWPGEKAAQKHTQANAKALWVAKSEGKPEAWKKACLDLNPELERLVLS